MKILHIINYLGRGGAEKLLVNILPVYKKLGLEVSVLQLSHHHAEAAYLKTLSDQGIECLSLDDASVYSPRHIASLANFLGKRHYDIVHVHLFPSLYWTALASKFLRQKPVLVYTEHSTQNKRSSKAYLQPLEKWIYSHYCKIVAISSKVKSSLEGRACAGQRIAVIQNGVDLEAFERSVGYQDSFWQENFGLPQNAVKLMITARIQYPKDHKTVIEALSYLPSNFYLFIAGDGPDREVIQAYTKEKGLESRVFFLGFRNDIPSLMKSVDINILSSAYEGMSGVTLEGLASGRPFLGSDVPGINDVVPSQEMLFPAGNSKTLSEKVRQLSALDEFELKKVIDMGLAHANQNSLLQMAKNHLDLYQELLS